MTAFKVGARFLPVSSFVVIMIGIMETRTRQIQTLNCTPIGQLQRYPPHCRASVLCVQEHRILVSKLPDVQKTILGMGWHGVWAPALHTEAGGNSSGVAVL
eukprot:3148767-Pyramimonas_sp.AAC.1